MLNNSKEKHTCVLGDGLTLPFADNAFDCVIFNGVIHHLGKKRGQSQEENIKRDKISILDRNFILKVTHKVHSTVIE